MMWGWAAAQRKAEKNVRMCGDFIMKESNQ